MNLLSDKIAITYGDLNGKPRFDAAWNRYTTVNDYAFIDDEELLCISIGPNLFLNCKVIVFLDPETGEDIEVLPYRDMTEEEFFQNTTVYDFGACDYDDIKFTQRHIDALQSMSGKYLLKVREQMQKMTDDMYQTLANEISREIDKEIMEKLNGLDWQPAEISIPQSPTPTTLASKPMFNAQEAAASIFSKSAATPVWGKGRI